MQPVGSQGLTLTGDKALARALLNLDQRVQSRVLGNALRAAMRPIVTASKQNARALSARESRAEKRQRRAGGRYRLHETIAQFTRTYPARKVKMVVAGPVYGAQYAYKGNIGHLVEFGHQKVLWGRRTDGQVQGYPFLKPAWDANIGLAQRVLAEKTAAGIEREATRVRSR